MIAISLLSSATLWAWNGSTNEMNVWGPAQNASLDNRQLATDLEGREIAKESISIYTPGGNTDLSEKEKPSLLTPSNMKIESVLKPLAEPSINVREQSYDHHRTLYVMPNSPAARQAIEWQHSRPFDAVIMAMLASQPTAQWFGDWNQNVENDVRAYTTAAQASNALPIAVAYNIPQRDCGSYSAGGTHSKEAYMEWIRTVARGIGSVPTLVVLEPDALAGMDCLNAADRATRQGLLADAITTLKQQSASIVYIDAGHARWHSATEMAKRLKAVDISAADGFSLNVSNFITSEESIAYGRILSEKIDDAHFVIDTSRNGAGPTDDMQWCNPPGRALGKLPSTRTGHALVDAYLWAKVPGESDGSCGGGPPAGVWWPDYALGLAKKARW